MKSNGHVRRPIHVLEILGNAIVGGMENYVRNLLKHLPPETFQVTLLAPFESALTTDLRREGLEVFVMAMEGEPSWQAIQKTVALIRREKVDLLHAHLPNAHQLAGLSGALTLRPVVATIHGMSIESRELGIQRATGSHLIVVCQQALIECRSLGVADRDLTLIYNGVDTGRFRPENDGTGFRRQAGIPADVPLVGFAGRLSHEKGPDIFLQAVQLIARRDDVAHFVLVGSGPMEEELRQTVQLLGLERRVHFAGLWGDMAGVYPAFDVLVQTSRIEGTPLVLLEAMASGLPVVAIGVGGVIEVVEVDSSGLLSGRADWADIGDNVLALLEQPEKRKAMGAAARQRVLERFTVAKSAAQTAALFHRLARRPQPARAGQKPAGREALRKHDGR